MFIPISLDTDGFNHLSWNTLLILLYSSDDILWLRQSSIPCFTVVKVVLSAFPYTGSSSTISGSFLRQPYQHIPEVEKIITIHAASPFFSYFTRSIKKERGASMCPHSAPRFYIMRHRQRLSSRKRHCFYIRLPYNNSCVYRRLSLYRIIAKIPFLAPESGNSPGWYTVSVLEFSTHILAYTQQHYEHKSRL